MTLKVLTIASTFPSSTLPLHGVFVKERLRAVNELGQTDIRVISPVPYFPPIKAAKQWYVYSQIPHRESIADLPVHRPRFIQPPKIGGYFQSNLMFPVVQRAFKQLHDFQPDFIDSHFVYPDGVVATRLAKQLGIPVMITCRGEDILRFPSLPLVGNRIRWALEHADRVVALSDEIANAAIANGAAPSRVVRIPNGVDTQSFKKVDQAGARRELNLPLDRKIIVSVGNRQERKGFHLLVDAMPEILRQHPDCILAIVGGPARSGPDYGRIIEERIIAHGLQDKVVLVGATPHEELFRWYSAADVFALMTSREGSPNVLLEALSCGVPAVATAIGGIPEVLADKRLGIVLDNRTSDDAAQGICDALEKQWDRDQIREIMTEQDWRATAKKVFSVFEALGRTTG
ncbi:glycosyltransferase [Rhodopirellula sp. MGV]|uniref:glycosyltransferase n=1 Tax=Rhodopirellula sp. MGV TaxID=2023130 RepID=UPI000B963D0C|nr:glycosyltransferase [Rhodopirellula sp. MGV]OYP33014.1 hypothetical protein CGZ80_19185 [Rhodopirellula sp. MGV]PNY35324.1 glycosyltransferase family 4 protein [Rhodopirellula baltica]